MHSLRREKEQYVSTINLVYFPWIKADALQAPTVVTRDEFPKRRPHPNLGDGFVSLSSFAQSRRQHALSPGGVSTPRANSNLRPARLLSEVGSSLRHLGLMLKRRAR